MGLAWFGELQRDKAARAAVMVKLRWLCAESRRTRVKRERRWVQSEEDGKKRKGKEEEKEEEGKKPRPVCNETLRLNIMEAWDGLIQI